MTACLTVNFFVTDYEEESIGADEIDFKQVDIRTLPINDSEMPYQLKLWGQTSVDSEAHEIGDFNLNMLVDLELIGC